MESKLRLEGSLKHQVESKLRLQVILRGQVESKLRLEGTWTAFKCVLECPRGGQERPSTAQEPPKYAPKASKSPAKLRKRSPRALAQQTRPPCKKHCFPKENHGFCRSGALWKGSLKGQVESKLRLEASLKDQMEFKWRLEAIFEGHMESKWHLEYTSKAFWCILPPSSS